MARHDVGGRPRLVKTGHGDRHGRRAMARSGQARPGRSRPLSELMAWQVRRVGATHDWQVAPRKSGRGMASEHGRPGEAWWAKDGKSGTTWSGQASHGTKRGERLCLLSPFVCLKINSTTR